MRRAWIAAVAVACAATAWSDAPVAPTPPTTTATIARIVVDGTINPAVADYLRDALDRARREQASALLIELDTPGGLLQSARAMVKAILGAPVPVIVWVAPSGAGAGSAGVFVTMAGHVAAMAPGTSIGAAHPVGGQGEDIPGDLGKKIANFTAAFSESIARQRGRNVAWATKAVLESVSLPADQAAKEHVVDFVARDLVELVQKASGREVDVAGTRRVLELRGAIGPDGSVHVVEYEMHLSQRVLNILADPNIAYLLMMAGLLGLYVELTHPGLGLPGVAGVICLVLGLTALHVLPVDWGALALLLVGAAMLVAEAFLPTFGVLGVGGLIAFLLGSLFLFDTERTGIAVARGIVIGAGGGLGLFMLLVGTLVVRGQRRVATEGREGMVGALGEAREPLAPRGTVMVRGEYWAAVADEPIAAGDAVEVVAVDGLTLRVRRTQSAQ